MRALIQRVSKASVTVRGEIVSAIGAGFVVLLGVGHGDGQAQADWLAEKIANLRVFEDEAGKMNLSILDVKGSALVVSQFTLYADAQKGRRPSFLNAAPPAEAEPLICYFVQKLESFGLPVKSGIFRAEMLVEIHNDGPVTIWLEKNGGD